MILSFLFGDDGEGARGAVWDGGPGAGVALIGRKGRIRRLSDGAPALLGAARGRLAARDFLELFDADDRTRVAAGLSLGAAAGVIAARTLAGAPLELRFSRRPDGRCTALLLAPSEARTGAPQDGAARAGAELLADLSHEMRTPLNAVIGFADAMTAETYGPLGHAKYQEYAGIIRASGRHLLDLVSSILDLARIEAGRYALRRETTDLKAIARECAGMIRIEAEKAGLALRVAIAEDVPESALDPRAMRQVIINLLANAVKFTSDGEIALEVRRLGEEIVVGVSDTGVGMSAEEVARIGRRYAAHGGDGVRGAKGSGLGLALAFALVELHGGTLRITSAPGEGVRAEMRVPVVAPARPTRRLRAVVAAKDAAGTAAAPAGVDPPAILTELERIEAFRRERARSAA
jgi:cell cycle sensor histidine kinase DivJ